MVDYHHYHSELSVNVEKVAFHPSLMLPEWACSSKSNDSCHGDDFFVCFFFWRLCLLMLSTQRHHDIMTDHPWMYDVSHTCSYLSAFKPQADVLLCQNKVLMNITTMAWPLTLPDALPLFIIFFNINKEFNNICHLYGEHKIPQSGVHQGNCRSMPGHAQGHERQHSGLRWLEKPLSTRVQKCWERSCPSGRWCHWLLQGTGGGVLQDAGTDPDLVSGVHGRHHTNKVRPVTHRQDERPKPVSLLLFCSRMNKNHFLFALSPPTFRNSSLLPSGAGLYLR